MPWELLVRMSLLKWEPCPKTYVLEPCCELRSALVLTPVSSRGSWQVPDLLVPVFASDRVMTFYLNHQGLLSDVRKVGPPECPLGPRVSAVAELRIQLAASQRPAS